MPPASPYRAPPPSAARVGWSELEVGPRTTVFVRDHGPQGLLALGAAALPLFWLGRVLARSLVGASAFTWAVVIVFAIGVIALWPRSRETIRIGPEGLSWHDRILASKARLAIGVVKVELVEVATGRALMLGDGRARYLVARGDAADVEEIARRFERALTAARAPESTDSSERP